MAIDYMEVFGIMGGLAARHPQTTGLLWQTYSLWSPHLGEVNKIAADYQKTAAQAKGPLDQAGIVLQLVAAHPNASALLKQTLTMWQTRVPDLLQVLDELQAAASAAAET